MSKKRLMLSLVSPEKTIYEGEINSIALPGSLGAFTILPQHAPIVSSLKSGKITYLTIGGEETVDIQSGFVEMSGEEVSVCIILKQAYNGNK